MFPFSMDSDIMIPLALFAIPIIAITGGITLGIVRAVGRQRTIELAQRERIAAIERGVDPSKLPSLDIGGRDVDGFLDFSDHQGSSLRRAQGLLIGGLVTLFAGVGVSVFLLVLRPDGSDARNAWAVGLVPVFVGAALLISSRLIWPRGANGQRQATGS